MVTLKNRKNIIHKRIAVDPDVDLFDNSRAEGSMIPNPRETPNHQWNPFALSFLCNEVIEPLFRWSSNYPHKPPWITLLHWVFITSNHFFPHFMCWILVLKCPLNATIPLCPQALVLSLLAIFYIGSGIRTYQLLKVVYFVHTYHAILLMWLVWLYWLHPCQIFIGTKSKDRFCHWVHCFQVISGL